MMNNMDIQVIEFGSELYDKSIELRYKVLREPLGLEYTAEQLAEEASEIHIAALSDDKVVGILLLKIVNEDILKMRQVAVDAKCRRQGVGARLVAFSEQYARQHHFSVIELHARDTAKDFYSRLGYQVEGDSFYEVGILHYKMNKVLR